MSPLKLNYRYFFITHCPVCCCRNGTVSAAHFAGLFSSTFSRVCQYIKV